MNRRKFIWQTSLSASGLALLPALIWSCKKKSLFEPKTYNGKVLIVGAGIAGLYAAYLLQRHGVEVQVMEASDRIGGRIKPLKNFADFTIELGAEEVHGQNSLWYDMLMATDAQWIEQELNNLYYFNGTLKTQSEAEQNTFFNQMTELIDSLTDFSGNDISAQTWGNNGGLSDNIEHLFNALIGNEHGTSNARLGMYGLREADEKWTAGDDNFVLQNKDFMSVIEEQFADVMDKILLKTTIVSIDSSAEKTILTDTNGTVYEADKVIVTVPLPVLKNNMIMFEPPLENDRLEALQKIGMDRGMKIILRFDERIWPENTGSIYGNGLVPEFWATGAGGKGTDNILTAFVNGANAEALASLGDNLINTLLTELDNILGEATEHYQDHHIQDWGAEPFIGGAYSYPKQGIGNAREVIAKGIGRKVFFAGEATHTGGHFATVHGAMETGLRAVSEILNA